MDDLYTRIFSYSFLVGVVVILFVIVLNVATNKRKKNASSLKVNNFLNVEPTETNKVDESTETDESAEFNEGEEEDMPDTLVDMLVDYYVSEGNETEIYGDTVTQCCYYMTDGHMCPVYKPDGTIYTIDELKPLLEQAYGCKIDMTENAKSE